MEKVFVSFTRLFVSIYTGKDSSSFRLLSGILFLCTRRVSDTLKLFSKHKSRNKRIAIGLYESPSLV